MNVYIKTFGCQMNVYDSDRIENIFLKNGFNIVDDPLISDIVLLNTCCVRNSAEQRAYGEIGNFKKLKDRNKELIIGVCGCIPAKEGENLKKRFPYLDLIIKPDEIENIEKIISSFKEREKLIPNKRKLKVSVFVTVIEGCNCSCAFCIVPYVRGRERSRNIQEIIEEVKIFAENGCKEVVLLGQNVSAYGSEFKERTNLSRLLKEVQKISGIERIKFVTSHPLWVRDELIKTVAEFPKVCEYFHLPIQAGDDGILKKMKRGYNVKYYEKLIEKIKSIIPQAVITTDIIVGFPGESEKNFKNTIKLVEKIKFDSAFTFMYSPRSHTEAKDFPEQVPLDVKKERLLILNELVKKIAFEKNKEYENKVVEVLVEEKVNNKLFSRARGNKIVEFAGEDNLIGNLVNVYIEKAEIWKLKGKIDL